MFFRNSQQFKYLCEVFNTLGDLLVNLEVTEQDLNQILDATIPYLSQQHNQNVQNACVAFIQNVSKSEACTVYIKLLAYADNKFFKSNVTLILNVLF